LWKQFVGFVAACAVGAILNYSVTVGILIALPGILPQLASFFGIVSGSFANFLFNRFAVFKYEHYRK
jgi:putative flippase GtrA